LSELYKKTKKKLIITTTCIEDNKTCYISHESDPELPLYIALRMSMCIPFFYSPIIYYGKHYVDGGCTCNYPIEFFKNSPEELKKVVGVYISTIHNDDRIKSFEDYLYRLIVLMVSIDSINTYENYKDNSILIPVKDIGIAELNLTKNKKKELCNIGYKACLEKLVVTI